MSAFEYATVRFARENRPQIDCIPQWHASLAVSECFVRVVKRLSDKSSSLNRYGETGVHNRPVQVH